MKQDEKQAPVWCGGLDHLVVRTSSSADPERGGRIQRVTKLRVPGRGQEAVIQIILNGLANEAKPKWGKCAWAFQLKDLLQHLGLFEPERKPFNIHEKRVTVVQPEGDKSVNRCLKTFYSFMAFQGCIPSRQQHLFAVGVVLFFFF